MQQHKSIAATLIRNTLYNTMGRSWLLITSLFLAPYIISRIGIERYGIWAIALSLSYFIDFFKFSIEGPLTKYVAEYHASNDTKKLNKLISTAFCIFVGFSLLISLIGLFLSPVLAELLNIEASLCAEAVFAFKIGVIIFSIINLSVYFSAILNGLQLMKIINKILIFSCIFRIIGVILILENNLGLKGLILIGLAEKIFSLCMSVWMTLKKCSWLKINPFLFNTPIFKQLFFFGIKVHLGRFAFFLSFHFDKFLLARFVGIASVGYYELAAKICFTIRRLAGIPITAILPAIAHAQANKREDIIQELFCRSIKYISIAACFLFFFLTLNANIVTSSWLRGYYPETILVIRILSLGYFFNTFANLLHIFSIGMGKPELDLKFSIFVAPLNALASIVLVLRFGLPGVVIGTSLSLILGTIFFIFLVHTNTALSYKTFIASVRIPLFASCFGCIGSILLYKVSFMSPSYISRIHDITAMGLHGIIFSVIFIVTSLAMGILDNRDLRALQSRLGNIFLIRIIEKINNIFKKGSS